MVAKVSSTTKIILSSGRVVMFDNAELAELKEVLGPNPERKYNYNPWHIYPEWYGVFPPKDTGHPFPDGYLVTCNTGEVVTP